ncbi:MAG: tetrathionate reductase family octaheme c-type cytochrome [Burkholderiaceae bacterium]
MFRFIRYWGVAIALALPGLASAGPDHSQFIKGPLKSGPEVTQQCVACHDKQAKDFMHTVHWTWQAQQKDGDKTVELGKKTAINNYCISLPANEPRCTSCHAGYGWKDKDFDFKKVENVDCLVCHDTTGSYKKTPTGAGLPDPKVDLLKVAQSVGPTSRATCGACHFFGGGGDHVKHGDLDSSLTTPTRAQDVHMAVDGANMSCSSCHKAADHVIPGKAMSVSVSGGASTLDCSTCHAGTPHKKNPLLDKHAARVACQTCHIPTVARSLPTKVWWDWSTAGQDREASKDKYGEKTYDKMKGSFEWAKNLKPSYFWFNGAVDRYLAGAVINPNEVVHLNSPRGSIADKTAKITPFKVMRGKQPYDMETRVIGTPHLFGGYWKHYDWNKAMTDGMQAAGLPAYSGKLGFVETDMVWKVNHMVVPKQQALSCNECHSPKGLMDWKALGYAGDPRELAKAKRK